MLRSKQISQLSQCARSFYITGSRYGTTDGSQCSSSDDDKHTKRQSKSSDTVTKQPKPHVLSPPNTGSSSLRNAIESTIHLTTNTSCTSPQVYAPISSLGSNVIAVNRKLNPNTKVVTASDLDSTPLSSSTHDYHPTTSKLISSTPIALKQALPYPQTHSVNPKPQTTPPKPQTTPPKPSSFEKPQCPSKYTKVQTNSFANAECRSSSSYVVPNAPVCRQEKSSSMRAKKNKVHSKVLHTHGITRQSVTETETFHTDYLHLDSESVRRDLDETCTVKNHESTCKFSQSLKSSRLQHQSGKNPVNSLLAIQQYYHVLQKQKWGSLTEVSLNNLEHKLDAFQANQVLKLIRDHSIALGFFIWLKRQPGFKHDEYTYTTMIGILGQAREFTAMINLLREMIGDGCMPTVVTYNRMIHAYGRANFIIDAVKVFDEMQRFGYEPDLVTYCTLIDIHAKAGFLDVALDLYQKMKAVGLSPDTFTYSVMVNCLGKGGRLAAAQDMYVEMIKNGCIPNLVTYNIMIALQSKSRNYDSAVKLYRDMQAAGFRPDHVTYNIVMEALGHCGRIEEAEAVFDEMRRYCVPDQPVYGLLVDMWGKAGNVERAHAWYRAMIDGGLKPNTPAGNSLLSAYLRAHRFSEARDLLLNMIWMGLEPSLQTYTLLLSCCTESNSEMVLCRELMSITGHPAHSFLSSLPDAEPNGKNVKDHTKHFFDLMHSEDRESKRGLVDAVVDFLHKSGLKEEAGLVWEVAAERNVYPDSLREKSKSHWLINLHVMSEGTAVTALSRTLAWFHRRILGTGVRPWRIDIITGWGRRSRVTGSSLVRQTVEELLYLFQFPFTCNSNSGCFVGCGQPLNEWLVNSYVERMHLL